MVKYQVRSHYLFVFVSVCAYQNMSRHTYQFLIYWRDNNVGSL